MLRAAGPRGAARGSMPQQPVRAAADELEPSRWSNARWIARQIENLLMCGEARKVGARDEESARVREATAELEVPSFAPLQHEDRKEPLGQVEDERRVVFQPSVQHDHRMLGW